MQRIEKGKHFIDFLVFNLLNWLFTVWNIKQTSFTEKNQLDVEHAITTEKKHLKALQDHLNPSSL